VATTGNGMGFKLGPLEHGTGFTQNRSTEIQHKLSNCISFENAGSGFQQNFGKSRIQIYNSTAYKNDGNGFNLADWAGHPYPYDSGLNLQINHIIKNCISYDNDGGIGSFNSYSTITGNSFNYSPNSPPYEMYGVGVTSITVTDNDFVSVDSSLVTSSRNSDYSLPTLSFLHLASNSELIDAGVDVDLPYSGDAPDVGAFEYIEA